MEGGRIIGQGTYGCVFDPPLLCSSGKTETAKGHIGKLGLRGDFKQEEEASQALRTLPNWSTYFLLVDPDSDCKPAAVDKQPQKKEILKCDIYEKEMERGWSPFRQKLIHYTMPYGGKLTYTTMMEKVESKSLSVSVTAIFERFLEAGAILTLAGIVHYDIHPNNFLLDPKTHLPKLIDFGFSFRPDTLRGITWKEYTPWHPVEPPEITVATGVRGGLTPKRAMFEVAQKKDYSRVAESILGLRRRDEGVSLMEFWNQSAAARDHQWLTFFKTYWPVFDAWSIGGLLLMLVRDWMSIPSIVNSEEWKQNFRRMKGVLRGLLHMSPLRRLDCVEALARWNPNSALLEGEKAQQWLAEREKVRLAIRH